MNFGGKIGVNIFVLIAGYFMINSNFKLKKLVGLWTEVLTFTISIYLICVLTGLESFSVKGVILAFIPAITNQYWFFTTYFALYLLIPIINHMINKFSEREFMCMITVGGCVFSVCLL